jgi:hypothetical protein
MSSFRLFCTAQFEICKQTSSSDRPFHPLYRLFSDAQPYCTIQHSTNTAINKLVESLRDPTPKLWVSTCCGFRLSVNSNLGRRFRLLNAPVFSNYRVLHLRVEKRYSSFAFVIAFCVALSFASASFAALWTYLASIRLYFRVLNDLQMFIDLFLCCLERKSSDCTCFSPQYDNCVRALFKLNRLPLNGRKSGTKSLKNARN